MKISFDSKGKASQLITIEGCDELENGYHILSHTTTVDLQGINLKSLDQGEGMFANTTLSSDTLNEIVTSIKEHPRSETHIIDLGYVSDNSIVSQIKEKGWTGTFNKGKYANCFTLDDVKAVDTNYQTDDIIAGEWSESLSSLTNGYQMFYNCTALTTFNCDDLSLLTNGNYMFDGCENLTAFNADLSSLTNGQAMFEYCKGLTTFNADLSSLTNGVVMFSHCENLTTFESDLSSLKDAHHMFSSCKLTSFEIDLSSLTDGGGMFFFCKNLTSFTSDLSSLVDGGSMFSHCENLTTFNCDDLSSLTNGFNMFSSCKNLTTFNCDLSSLARGEDMFKGCWLKVDSIVRIANSLPLRFDYSEIHIGNLGESISGRIIEACELMGMKGWTVKHGDNDKVYTNQRYIPSDIYNLCQTTDEVKGKNSNYGSDVINGFWINPLQNLRDGRSLFYANRTISDFCADLSSLEHGGKMFYSMIGASVDDLSLINFCSSMPKLENGEAMFACDTQLKTFKGGLEKLTNGFEMFYDCTALSVFNEDLTTLTNGAAMFRNCASLPELNFDLQSMVDGSNMFNLFNEEYAPTFTSSYTSFKGNLSSLVQGHSMFRKRLRSFDGSLSSLEIGKDMFKECCLDKKSIKKIASSIKRLPKNPSWTKPEEYDTAQNYNGGQSWWKDSWDDSNRGIITLGIDSRLKGDNEVQDYLKQIGYKNWTVEEEYNELPSADANKIKYINCTKPENVSTVEPNYKTVDVINGIWSEPLPNLQDGNIGGYQTGMFQQNTKLVSFNADLSSLIDGEKMFFNCSKLESFNSDLSSLTNGYGMFYVCEKLSSFTSDLHSLTNGERMFYECTALTSFTSDLHSLTNGEWMFYNCDGLISFNSDLSSLTNGNYMFYGCFKLKNFSSDSPDSSVALGNLETANGMFENAGLISFNSDLNSLTEGMYMFKGCSYLETFGKKDGTPINLEKLEKGTQMFSNCSNLKEVNCSLNALTTAGYMFSNCSNLTRFDADLSKLGYAGGMFEYSGIELFSNDMAEVTEAGRMFYACMALESFTSKLDNLNHGEYMFNGCSALTSFDVDMSKLTNGHYMFNGCTSLTSFESDLQSLIYGMYMFRDCKLNEKSLQNISETINDLKSQYKSGRIDIGLDESVSQSVYFECGNKLMDKGWKVYFNDALYEYTTIGSPNDVSEANGWCPKAYKSDTNNWNANVYIPKNLIITEITSKGEMINNG